jgi:hypothetical protein
MKPAIVQMKETHGVSHTLKQKPKAKKRKEMKIIRKAANPKCSHAVESPHKIVESGKSSVPFWASEREPYDPAHPNLYETFMDEKKLIQEAHEAAKVASKRMEEFPEIVGTDVAYAMMHKMGWTDGQGIVVDPANCLPSSSTDQLPLIFLEFQSLGLGTPEDRDR